MDFMNRKKFFILGYAYSEQKGYRVTVLSKRNGKETEISIDSQIAQQVRTRLWGN